MTPEQRERYLRHILLREVGAQGQKKLLAARALVVGAGGIGSPVLQYLAAAGVGAIGVADDDAVAVSNLQRQVIYRTADIGGAKTSAAREALARLNPDIAVTEHNLRLDHESAARLAKDYDVVIEGVDTFETRYALNKACIDARRPLVSAAIGRFDIQLSVFKPWAGEDLPCYRCLVPEPPPRDMQVNCAEEGVLGPVAGIAGSLAALEAIKEILGLGEGLAGRLLVYDGLRAQARTVRLPRDPQCPDCGAISRAPPIP